MLYSCSPVNKEVQTMFTPILIRDKNTRELKNNVNPVSKKVKIFTFFWTFYVPTKKLGKVGEKQSIMSLSM